MTDFPQRDNQTPGDRTKMERAANSAEGIKDAVSSASEKIGSGLNEAASVLKTKALEIVEPVTDHAVHVAEEQIGTGAAKVEGIARAVHEAADKIEGQIPHAGTYVHQLADRLDDASRMAREQKMSDIVRAVDDFAHRQPLAFFGATILAGFALTRFMKSTNSGNGQSWQSRGQADNPGWTPEYSAPDRGGIP